MKWSRERQEWLILSNIKLETVSLCVYVWIMDLFRLLSVQLGDTDAYTIKNFRNDSTNHFIVHNTLT